MLVKIRVCRICGITDYKKCSCNCCWVEHNLCNKCANVDKEVKKNEIKKS